MPLFRKQQAEQRQADDRAELVDELAVLRQTLAHYPTGTFLHFGAPCRCPDCGDYGLVDQVDPQRGRASNECHSCKRRWVITRRALRAYRADPSLAVHPLPPLAESAPVLTWSAPPAPGEPSGVLRPLDEATARFAASQWAPPPPDPSLTTPTDDRAETKPLFGDEPATDDPAAHEPAIHEPAMDDAPADEVPDGLAAAGLGVIDLDQPAGVDVAALTVLVVDDNPFDTAAVEQLLAHAGQPVTVLTAPTRADGYSIMRTQTVDVVLLTLDLPDSVGLATMVDWQLHPGATAPIVAVVADSDPTEIRGARAAGARQVVQKRHLTQLAEDPATGGPRLATLLRQASEVLVSPG